MKKLFTTFFVLFLFFIGGGINFSYAGNSTIDVKLGVSGCNNDGRCNNDENRASCPSDCTSGGVGGTILGVSLSNIVVVADTTTATISWDSSLGTLSTLKWGMTTEVKEGVLSSTIFSIKHKVELSNLKPGTIYYFTIESRDFIGRITTSQPIVFVTKILKDTIFPQNPTNVKAVVVDTGVKLTWKNPTQPDFSYVRIMRHEDGYRGNPYSGVLIYEGRDESFIDTNVVDGKKYFYTLFSRDINGNFSSGTAVSILYSLGKVVPPVIPEVVVPPIEYPQSSTLMRYMVHQYNREVYLLNDKETINVVSEESVIIDTEDTAKENDWILIQNSKGEDFGIFTFLFNKDNKRYQSVIPPFLEDGIYSVTIFRYADSGLEILGRGSLSATSGNLGVINEKTNNPLLCFDIFYGQLFFYILILLLLILIAILSYKLWRKKKVRNLY